MNKELKKQIKAYFPPKEGERIITLIHDEGIMKRDPKNSNYTLTLRGIAKLRKAKRLLEFKEISNIVKDKRRKEQE